MALTGFRLWAIRLRRTGLACNDQVDDFVAGARRGEVLMLLPADVVEALNGDDVDARARALRELDETLGRFS